MLITKKDFAKLMRVSKQMVSWWLKMRVIRETKKGLLDETECRQAVERYRQRKVKESAFDSIDLGIDLDFSKL